MSKYGVMVLGPAGAGKSTLCAALIQHLHHFRRACYYINLDPAASEFAYEPDIDIRDLISLEDVMEELDLGPNGGLVYCFEFLLDNLDFLTQPLESATEEYLIVFDMPGQIELYTHVPILPTLFKCLTRGMLNMNLCVTYLLEATFIVDRAKFFAGTLSAMSAMLMLEVPHINVISKIDLVKDTMSKQKIIQVLRPTLSLLDGKIANDDQHTKELDCTNMSQLERGGSVNQSSNKVRTFHGLNRAVAELIEQFGVVDFLQLNSQDEDSVDAILSHIDNAIQYHEAQEPREPVELANEDE